MQEFHRRWNSFFGRCGRLSEGIPALNMKSQLLVHFFQQMNDRLELFPTQPDRLLNEPPLILRQAERLIFICEELGERNSKCTAHALKRLDFRRVVVFVPGVHRGEGEAGAFGELVFGPSLLFAEGVDFLEDVVHVGFLWILFASNSAACC